MFAGAYHELQKEPIKDQVFSKVLTFAQSLINLGGLNSFGKFNEKHIRHGSLPIRKPAFSKSLKRKLIIALIGYIAIGLW